MNRTTATSPPSRNLTKRFGNLPPSTVDFEIRRGEIFGFLGSNGCGKTTTMKMLTGLLPASEVEAWLFGKPVDPHDLETPPRGLHVPVLLPLFRADGSAESGTARQTVPVARGGAIPGRVQERMERRTDRGRRELPGNLPLGQRQRLSLAVALIHQPEMLILDEPTSGVDPRYGRLRRILTNPPPQPTPLILRRTHFMNEMAAGTVSR